MTDLRKAAEMALKALEGDSLPFQLGARAALRQALAQPDEVLVEREACAKVADQWDTAITDKVAEAIRARSENPPVKSYCGGKPNYCTPEVTPDVDAVNMSQERVDETEKRKHDPWPSVQCACGATIYFKYTPPISDYHEGWEEGFKAATREQEPFIYVREDNEKPFGGFEHCSEADAGAFPVYTAPPKREWVGLTKEDMPVGDNPIFDTDEFAFGAAWAQAKLKEKNS